MAKTSVTTEDCEKAFKRLMKAAGEEEAQFTEDDGKFRIGFVDGKKIQMIGKSMGPSLFVNCCNFATDFIDFLESKEEDKGN